MDPDQNKSHLPVKSDSSPTRVSGGSEIQGAPGLLPRSDSIRIEEKISIARDEGFHPLAIDLAVGSYETSPVHKLLLFGLAVIAAALVAILFPVDRFFKPHTRDLGTMTIGDPITDENPALLLEFNKPWMKVLLEMDRLYFREGKLSEAIQVAETSLERVPESNWEAWKKVHYRYWELLSDAGRTLSLKAATKSYLQAIPEDPFANYYSAHAFLKAVESVRSLDRDTRRAYREDAEALLRQTDRAANALRARQKAGGSAEKKRLLQDLYQKIRLQQAELFVLIWRLGGYKEDRHPDVVYRDRALDILNHAELADLKEAKALKISIYSHILDRWHWFEGQQVIQGTKQHRRSMAQELKALQKELKDAEAL